MKRRIELIAASLFFVIGGSSLTQQPRTSEAQSPSREGQHLLDGNCALIKSTRLLPDPLKAAFAELTREREFELADPGEKFQVGDVIVNPRLPWRRLILAGRCGDRWFIHYERGGRGHSFALVVFESASQQEFRFISGATGLPKPEQIVDLRKELEDKKFISDPHSYW